MSQHEHTPSPWRDAGAVRTERGQRRDIDIVAGAITVATVRKDADARLVAAAPELFDAVEELLHALEYFGAVGPVAQHARQLGQAALCKALKGEV